jgi:hypothetical protein
MKAPGQYDPTLQMFKEQPREVDMARLQFLRWLGERGLLEHAVAGASVGELAVSAESLATATTA